jgi:glycosyltransferase involved in cell wall biosynthesis
MLKVCLDLTPNEMRDRHGGFGRYGYYLLENLLALPAAERGDLEILAAPRSDSAPITAEEALKREILEHPPIGNDRHRMQRRFILGRKMRRAGIDLFHSVHPGSLPLGSGAKLLITCHDLIPVVLPSPKTSLYQRFNRKKDFVQHLSRHWRADHILAISESTRQDLIRSFRLPESRISVVHHGIDTHRFPEQEDANEKDILREKYDLPDRYFICVGSDNYRKNQTRLFEAWANASSSIPEGLVLVGRPMYENIFQGLYDQANARGLGQRFRWLNDVDDAELPALYRQATAMVSPSEYEGFGMTLLEAMACGAPVAASNTSSHPEVGQDAALFFDPYSVKEIEDVLRQLSTNGELRQQLNTRAQQLLTTFPWSATARNTLTLYKSVLGIRD